MVCGNIPAPAEISVNTRFIGNHGGCSNHTVHVRSSIWLCSCFGASEKGESTGCVLGLIGWSFANSRVCFVGNVAKFDSLAGEYLWLPVYCWFWMRYQHPFLACAGSVRSGTARQR